MKRITQDGTKIKAYASSSSFKRKNTLEKNLKLAKEQVELLSEPNSEPISPRKKKSAKEKVSLVEKAIEEYEELEKKKKNSKKEIRVSKTDPESRIMKRIILFFIYKH